MAKELKAKHFQYYDEGETYGLLQFVKNNNITNIVSITSAGKFSEGYVLFYWEETEKTDTHG